MRAVRSQKLSFSSLAGPGPALKEEEATQLEGPQAGDGGGGDRGRGRGKGEAVAMVAATLDKGS